MQILLTCVFHLKLFVRSAKIFHIFYFQRPSPLKDRKFVSFWFVYLLVYRHYIVFDWLESDGHSLLNNQDYIYPSEVSMFPQTL